MSTPESRVLDRLAVAMVAVTGAVMVKSTAAPVGDTDVWWNLRLGVDLQNQAWWGPPPRLSTFATASWAPTEALPDVIGAKVEQWFGLPGLAWLYGLAMVAVLLTMYCALRRIASPLPAALATLLSILACTQSLTPRPQMVSLCLLPVVVVAWLRSSQDHGARWWLIPLFWLWSCCHGFWFIGGLLGLAVAGTTIVTRQVDAGAAMRLLATAIGSMAVVLLSPVGPRVFLAPFVVRDRAAYIIEWHRTDLLSPAALVVLVMVVLVLVLDAAQRRVDPVRFVLLAAALFFTWYSSRTVSVAGILAGVLVGDALERILARGIRRPARRPRGGESISLAATAAALLVVLGLVVPHTSANPAVVPTALDRRLDAVPAGTVVFNNYEIGGWLAWRHPDLDHYIDPLADAYPVSHLQRYVQALHAQPGWHQIITVSHATVAVLQVGEPLARALEQLKWTVAGRSRGYVMLEAP